MDNELFNAVCFLEMMDYFDAQKKKATAEFQANVQRRNAARRQVQQEISQNASLIQTSTEAYLKKQYSSEMRLSRNWRQKTNA